MSKAQPRENLPRRQVRVDLLQNRFRLGPENSQN
jgi:hypothetical protein